MLRLPELRLLVADDHEPVRTLYVTLLEEIDGVGSVTAAADGFEAVQLAERAEFDVAVLDLHMPHLDGVDAALELATLQPTLSIALHSSDPDALRLRAAGLGFALFDKVQFELVVAWVENEVWRRRRSRSRRRDLRCARCSYGIATDLPPPRCPMCGNAAEWVDDARVRFRATA